MSVSKLIFLAIALFPGLWGQGVALVDEGDGELLCPGNELLEGLLSLGVIAATAGGDTVLSDVADFVVDPIDAGIDERRPLSGLRALVVASNGLLGRRTVAKVAVACDELFELRFRKLEGVTALLGVLLVVTEELRKARIGGLRGQAGLPC